jgi:hypothetical protein
MFTYFSFGLGTAVAVGRLGAGGGIFVIKLSPFIPGTTGLLNEDGVLDSKL